MSQELSDKEISNAFFDKLKITYEEERSIKENSHNVNNDIKTVISDSIARKKETPRNRLYF